MFRTILSQVMNWLWPPRLFLGIGRLLTEWQRADIKDRGLLLLLFSPALACAAGLLFSIVSFVLFVLPSFVIRVLSWGLLAALFGSAALYGYDRLKGNARGKTDTASDETIFDASFTEDSGPSSSQRPSQNDFDQTQKEAHRRWFESVKRGRNEK